MVSFMLSKNDEFVIIGYRNDVPCEISLLSCQIVSKLPLFFPITPASAASMYVRTVGEKGHDGFIYAIKK